MSEEIKVVQVAGGGATVVQTGSAGAATAQASAVKAAQALDAVEALKEQIDAARGAVDEAKDLVDSAVEAIALATTHIEGEREAVDLARGAVDAAKTAVDQAKGEVDAKASAVETARAQAEQFLQLAQAAAAQGAAQLNEIFTQFAGAAAILTVLASAGAQADTAANQARLAEAAARSASSVVQQDLSGVTQALHRSPNAVVATCFMDASKDSDPAWPQRMAHASWENEPLAGTWLSNSAALDPLRGHQNETDARLVGATMGPELVTNGTFADGTTTGWEATSGAVLSVVNGRMRVLDGSLNFGKARQVVPTVIGRLYVIRVDRPGTGTALGSYIVGSATGTPSNIFNSPVESARWFVATSTTTVVCAQVGAGLYADFDNISIREVTAINTKSGDYFQLAADGKHYRLNGTYVPGGALPGTTEVFRGNKRQFPAAGAVAVGEAGRLVIYDTAEPGCPMWMVVTPTGAVAPLNQLWRTARLLTSMAWVEGALYFGANIGAGDSTSSGLCFIDFAGDQIGRYSGTNGDVAPAASGVYGNVAQRHAGVPVLKKLPVITSSSTTGQLVNAVATMVRSNAPVNPATGLRVPTIGVAVGTGNAGQVGSVIMDDGSVVNYSNPGFDGISVAFTQRGDIAWGLGNSTQILVMPLQTANLTNIFAYRGYGVTTAPNGGPGNAKRLVSAGALLATRGNTQNVLTLIRENSATPGAGASAQITPTYNTGWMRGDVRRKWLCEAAASARSAGASVVNGAFATDLSGWTKSLSGTSDVAWSADGATFTGDGSNQGRLYQAYPATVLGQMYVVSFDVTAGSGVVGASLGSAPATSDLVATSTFAPGSGRTFFFLGTGGTVYLTFNRSALGAISIKNVSVGAVVADRSYKGKHLNISGTLALAAVATAAQQVAASGWSTTNYLQEAYSADLDFGTGPFCVTAKASVPVTGFGPQNKCSGYNANPPQAIGTTATSATVNAITGLTLQSVHANTIVSIVDDAVELTAAGLSGICTSGKVYKIDNSAAPTAAIVACLGDSGNTSQHTASAYIRGGSARIRSVAAAGVFVAGSAGYQRREFAFTAYANSDRCVIQAEPGAIVYFILGQLEAGPAAKPVIAVAGSAFNGIAPIIDRSASTGARWTVGIDGNGMWAAEVSDGTTTRRVTGTQAANTGTFQEVQADYAAGVVTLKVNAQQQAQATGAVLGSLNNANAVCTVGNARTLDAAFPGSIAMLEIGATTPSQAAHEWMWSQEQQMFREGAQVTQPDTGNIVGHTYDRSLNSVRVATASNEARFSGLVRVESLPVVAGAIAAIDGEGGTKLLARTGAYPGVDIVIPAQNLKEKLRNEEAAARRGPVTRRFDYDLTTGMTDLVVPAGWEIQGLTVAGVDKRESPPGTTTKDWGRLYDGFVETARFHSAPGNVWVQAELRRAA